MAEPTRLQFQRHVMADGSVAFTRRPDTLELSQGKRDKGEPRQATVDGHLYSEWSDGSFAVSKPRTLTEDQIRAARQLGFDVDEVVKQQQSGMSPKDAAAFARRLGFVGEAK